MSPQEKEVLREKIFEQIQQTQNDVENLIELTKPIPPENSIGRVSRMDAINNKSVNEANLRRSRAKLTKLEMALGKIEGPNFGICVKCKKTIQAGRLMYMPESSTCVKCAG